MKITHAPGPGPGVRSRTPLRVQVGPVGGATTDLELAPGESADVETAGTDLVEVRARAGHRSVRWLGAPDRAMEVGLTPWRPWQRQYTRLFVKKAGDTTPGCRRDRIRWRLSMLIPLLYLALLGLAIAEPRLRTVDVILLGLLGLVITVVAVRAVLGERAFHRTHRAADPEPARPAGRTGTLSRSG